MDMHDLVTLLRRKWIRILAVGLATAGLAYGLSATQADTYQASASLLFRTNDLAQTLFGNNAQESPRAPERAAATNLTLASLDSVARNVARRVASSHRPVNAEKLRDRVSIKPKGQADVVVLTARAASPTEAAQIANAFATEIVAGRRASARSKVQEAIRLLARQATAGEVPPEVARDRKRRIEQLEVVKSLQNGDAEVVERARPPHSRAGPTPVRNSVIGALLGCMLAVLAVIGISRFDRRLKSEEALTEFLDVPLLARIPIKKLGRGDNESEDILLLEAFQFLRTNLQFQDPDRTVQVIAVTSALPSEGKTTVTVGLAEALCMSGSKVVLVDCDIRRPTLHERLGTLDHPGIINVLAHGRELHETVHDTDRDGLQVVPAGRIPLALPSAHLHSGSLKEAIGRLLSDADYVIIDTSPLSVAADASAVAAMADGVILVCDINRTTRDDLSLAMRQLVQSKAPLIGAVANRAGLVSAGYYGSHYYRRQQDDQNEAVTSDSAVGTADER